MKKEIFRQSSRLMLLKQKMMFVVGDNAG